MIDDRTARAALTRLFEPGDTVGLALVARHGAHTALRIAIGARPAYPFADVSAGDLAAALDRWAPRVRTLDAEADLMELKKVKRLQSALQEVGGALTDSGSLQWNDLLSAERASLGSGMPLTNTLPAPPVTMAGSNQGLSGPSLDTL